MPISDLEYLVVGSGLTGATIARVLHDAGKKVAIVERRNHSGGNVHETTHSGFTYHTYGPHYFHTNSQQVWQFVQKFSAFTPFNPTIKTLIDGSIEDWPLRKSQVIRFAGSANWQPHFKGTPSNFEEECLARLPKVVYEKFILGYTEKQWGVPASTLYRYLAKRISILDDDQCFGSSFRYSALPSDGYGAFIDNLLRDIPLTLNFDFLKHRHEVEPTHCTIYTGPIDEYFDYDLGKLQYRGQRREHSILTAKGFAQPAIQLNNPSASNGSHTRTIEWKHLPGSDAESNTTLLTKEFPFFPDEPDQYEYPMPNESNASLYEEYRQRILKLDNVLMCGRLGEYRYYDMDQAIARALTLAERLLATNTVN